jgi:isopropylmalate/homocitrate/citramalate synthase
MPNLPKKFFVRDITMKAGATHEPGCFLDVDGVLKIVEKLVEAGVRELDCGRCYSQRDLEVMKRVKEAGLNIKLCASVGEYDRPGIVLDKEHYHKYIDICFRNGADSIKLNWESGTTTTLRPKEIMLLGIPVVLDAIDYVHKEYNTDVSLSTADNTRLSMDTQLYFHKKLVDAGIDRLWVSDEGNANPSAFKYVVSEFRKVCGDTQFVLHVHNTWGVGLANIIAGVEAGGPMPVWADLSVNGIGLAEAIDEVVLALEFLYGIDTGIKLDKLYELSQVAQEVTGIDASWSKPHTGKTAHIENVGDVVMGFRPPEKQFEDPVAMTFNYKIINAPNETRAWWGEIPLFIMKEALDYLGLRSTDSDVQTMVKWIQDECRKETTVRDHKHFVMWEEFVEQAKRIIPKVRS